MYILLRKGAEIYNTLADGCSRGGERAIAFYEREFTSVRQGGPSHK
jgi:hypothetical protein